MDRDPLSPTFGCFDRNYWHYKIRDFPSSILQQGVFTVEALRSGILTNDVARDVAERWSVGAISAFSRQIDANGGVDEYYPFERSYPAAAFGMYAVARVLFDWRESASSLTDSIDLRPIQQLIVNLSQRVESEASNQQAAGLAGLALAAATCLFDIDDDIIRGHAVRLLQSQHVEGWFDEYGGPDFGYLTVTIDALTDYFDATGDDRAIKAIDSAVSFIARCVGCDGRLPSTLNSRNTDYVVPYGLVRAGARNPIASWLVQTLFRDIDEPSHFLWATDDRYHTHYIFASIVRSLPHLATMLPPSTPEWDTCDWMDGAGYGIRRAENREWTVFVGARKGGLVRIHSRDGGTVRVDHGWRVLDGKHIWTTNWWSKQWRVSRNDDCITVEGPCQDVRFHIASPLRNGALRIVSFLTRDKLIPLLKRKMIFRPNTNPGPAFKRTITVSDASVRVADHFEKHSGATAYRSPRQNLRHVASADSFSAEEFLTSVDQTKHAIPLDTARDIEHEIRLERNIIGDSSR